MGENSCYITDKQKNRHYLRILLILSIVFAASFIGGWWGSKAYYYGSGSNEGITIVISFDDIKLSVYDNPTNRILIAPADASNYMVDMANITFMMIASETINQFREYNFENESEALKYFNVTSSDMLIIKGEYTMHLSSFVANNASLPLNASVGLDLSAFNFTMHGFAMIIKEVSMRVINISTNSEVDTVVMHPYAIQHINEYIINGTSMSGLWSENSVHSLNFVEFDYYQSASAIGRIKYDIDGIAYAHDLA